MNKTLARIVLPVSVIGAVAFGSAGMAVAGPIGTANDCHVAKPQDSNACVSWVQSRLNQLDNAGLAVDGMYGGKTTAAVRNFQQKHHLGVDGIIGPQTLGQLGDYPAGPHPRPA